MKKNKKDTNKSKEIKFETTQLKNTTVDHDNSAVVTFIVALIVIALLVGGLYYVNAKYVTKDKYQDDTTTTTTKEPSYDATVILAEDILKQKEKEYMVVLFDKSTDDASYISSLVSGYKGDSKIYSVDLSNKMNADFVSKKQVSNPTLYVVKKGKIVETLTEKDKIYSKIDGVKFN
jgi:hypothetical protein